MSAQGPNSEGDGEVNRPSRTAVDVEPGYHRADSVEGGEGGVFVGTRHHKRVQRDEHDAHTSYLHDTFVLGSASPTAARLEGTSIWREYFISTMKITSSCAGIRMYRLASPVDPDRNYGTIRKPV